MIVIKYPVICSGRYVHFSFLRCVLIGAFSLIVLIQCSHMQLAGSISETTNGKVAGIIADKEGPVEGATVKILPVDFNPVHDSLANAWQTTTDADGAYEVKNLTEGEYNLIARYKNSAVLIPFVRITAQDTNLTAAPGLLEPTGSIRVVFGLTQGYPKGYFYIPGTDTAVKIDLFALASGEAIFTGVPAGRYFDLRFVQTGTGSGTNVLSNILEIVPSGFVTVGSLQSWRYSRSVVLNTTVSGASVPGNVYNFPVCVRLTTANFKFSEARGDGRDIRIAKSDNTLLPYETERWDSANGIAELWVKVDTVFGNTLTNLIMYWGNDAVSPESNGEAVFDTLHGFQGVWHLGEPGGNNAYDATGNHYTGSVYNMTPASVVPGAIGIARAFDGASTWIEMQQTKLSKLDFPEDGTYALSAWVYADSVSVNGDMILQKSTRQYKLQLDGAQNWKFAEYQDSQGWDETTWPGDLKKWTYIAGVRSGNKQFLYANGVCVDISVTLAASANPRVSGLNFLIGKVSAGAANYFNGTIDEVCVSNVVRSADWIRLCYMNQKSIDALVSFK